MCESFSNHENKYSYIRNVFFTTSTIINPKLGLALLSFLNKTLQIILNIQTPQWPYLVIVYKDLQHVKHSRGLSRYEKRCSTRTLSAEFWIVYFCYPAMWLQARHWRVVGFPIKWVTVFCKPKFQPKLNLTFNLIVAILIYSLMGN